MLAILNGFMVKNSESRTMPDARDSIEPSIFLLKTEEDHRTHTIKETVDIKTVDTRTTVEEDKTTETEDASPLPKAETTWMSTP